MFSPSVVGTALRILTLATVVTAMTLPRQESVKVLSPAEIHSFKPFTFFAGAAYCNPNKTINWSCGAKCSANPGFIPVAAGGDGAETQFWFVGFDPALHTVIVAHQGTVGAKIIPLLTDGDFFLKPLDQTLFPGTSGLKVHGGIGASEARSARDILAAVKKALATHSSNSVTIVGHSLGAALGLIDAVFLPLHLPQGIKFKFVGYSMPRVGNSAFAAYLDTHFPDLTHITNKDDFVPILPGRFLGFHHPHGEIHVEDSGEWESCPGDDNTSNLCSTGDVENIFFGNRKDHDGPFDGVSIGC